MANRLVQDPRKIAVLAASWIIAVLVILGSSPATPRTWADWLLLVFVGVPLYLAGEVGFAWLLSPKRGAAASERKFSWVRVLVAFVAALAAVALWSAASSGFLR